MDFIGDFLIDFINLVILGLSEVINLLLFLFPDTPFGQPSTPPDAINLGWITWVFDFPTWIAHFALILMAIAFYYAIRIVARWLKVVRS